MSTCICASTHLFVILCTLCSLYATVTTINMTDPLLSFSFTPYHSSNFFLQIFNLGEGAKKHIISKNILRVVLSFIQLTLHFSFSNKIQQVICRHAQNGFVHRFTFFVPSSNCSLYPSHVSLCTQQ